MINLLAYSVFATGAITTLAGFTGLFYPPLSFILILPLGLIMAIGLDWATKLDRLPKLEKIILLLLILWWLIHLVQVFVPETGFDALWYHLPVAQQVTQNHRFMGDTGLYQSFNPLFADSIFFLGYQLLGSLGTKLVAYFFGIFLILLSYSLARQVLNRQLSLISLLIVSGFQVVSWQAASFYIDLAKASFEIAALTLILQNKHFQSALFLGASLASKLFSLALLPIFIIISKRPTYLLALLIALPYYLLAQQTTGNPFFSLGQTAVDLNLSAYLLKQTMQIYKLPFFLVFSRDYTNPLLVALFPLLLILKPKLPIKQKSLLIFGLSQLALWWYLPPLSTRYALSGFIALTFICIHLLHQLWLQKNWPLSNLIIGLSLMGLIALPVRLMVVNRSLRYLNGHQTKSEYLNQFLDGNLDPHLKPWD